MNSVPFNDLVRASEEQNPELREAVLGVLASGWYVQGTEHDHFERSFASFVGASDCVGVASGTDALTLALRAVTATRDATHVVTAANAGGYTTAASRLNGLAPRYVDVSPETLCLTASNVESALDDDVAAVVVTHLYGRMAPAENIVALCRPRGIPVIEDCAQCAGAQRNGRAAGSIGDAAAFSFYPTKNLGAAGDAGAVVTSDPAVATAVRELRQYGWSTKYRVARPDGTNSRLDEIQAAVLNVRLPALTDNNTRRREIIGRYAEAAAMVPGLRVLNAEDTSHAAHLAVALAEDRARVRKQLTAQGVGTAIHYPVPDHRQSVVADAPPMLPVTEHAADHVLSLPCFPQLRDDEVDYVCAAIHSLRPGHKSHDSVRAPNGPR